jgi:hypothetical protein
MTALAAAYGAATEWTTQPDGQRTRRWLEYYDWGACTEPRCPRRGHLASGAHLV